MVEKITASTLCFMHQSTFRPNYILIAMLVLKFLRKIIQKKKKKKKKKKTFVKFCEELLYFQYSVKIFFLCSKSVIITTFKKIEYISLLCLLAWLVWITLICSNYPCLENILWFQGVRAIEVILYS